MKVKTITLVALLSALCAIGSFIKIPMPGTSAALDSTPAFLSIFLLPPPLAGLVGAIGHFATAVTSGFPQGPFHILVAFFMFVTVWGMGVLHKKGHKILVWVWAIVVNGILSPLPFYWIMSPQMYAIIAPIILIATVVNVVIAIIVAPVLNKVFMRVRVK